MRPFSEIPYLASMVEVLQLARKDPLGGLGQLAAQKVDLGRFTSFFGSLVAVNSPELVHEVLVARAKDFEKSPAVRASLFPLAGEGLLSSGGALWRRQRKLMAPLFAPAAVARMDGAMTQAARRVAATWADGSVVDLSREMTRIAMAIASKAFFDLDSFEESDAIGRALSVVLEWIGTATTSLPVVLQSTAAAAAAQLAERLPEPVKGPAVRWAEAAQVPIMWPTAQNRAMRRALAELDALVDRLIAARRADPQRFNDLLSLLLAAQDDDGTKMSDRQVRDEMLTLFVAGHETTANALAWTASLLGQHSEWYARACGEARALESEPGAADLRSLGALTRVFQEALRLYPPIFIVGRVATRDTSVGDYALPRGTAVLVSPYALHRRPELWPEPERFDPDRFAVEREGARLKTSYLPFGAGPRVCIGGAFAMLEGPLVLATLLRHVDLTLVEAAVPQPTVTLRPRSGPLMRVNRRAPASRGRY
jgi:cytochrome P450